MFRCKMFKISVLDHQTINMVVKQFLCSNMYSLHVQHFVKNVVSSFWNVNINFSYVNIGQKKNVLKNRYAL